MVLSGAGDEELEPAQGPAPGTGPGPDAALPMWPDVAAQGPAGAGPGHQGPQDGVPSWPASGLPPSFGRRSTEGERPAVAPPAPGSGYGGFRPLGSLPPSGPPPGSLSPGGPGRHQAGAGRPAPEAERHETGEPPDGPGGDWTEPGIYRDEQGAPWEEPGRGWPGVGGSGWQTRAGPDTAGGPGDGAGPEPGAEPDPRAGFGPWETYE